MTTETLVLDYSFARPSPAAIKAAGYTAVIRYLSTIPGADVNPKDLKPAERDALHAAGLGIGLVWETTANRAGQGIAAGRADAQAACAQARALGYPPRSPIWYAVDFDTTWAVVRPYFAGVTSVSTYPVGVYGSYQIIQAANVPYLWQACAWSGGKVSSRAHLYQRLHPTVAHPIPGTDENLLITPLPLWQPTTAPPPQKGPEMPLTSAEIDAIAVATSRELLGTMLGSSGPTVAVALQRGNPVDVKALAAAVAGTAPAGGATVTQAQLEAALRTVLGGVDGK